MPDYEFFISNAKPQPANRAVRSHAMKTALQIKNKKERSDREIQHSSELSSRSVSSAASMRGRFHVSRKPEANNKIRKAARKESETPTESHRTGQKLNQLDSRPRPKAPHRDWEPLVHTNCHLSPPPSRFGNHTLDPFDTLPEGNSWKFDLLIKYCKCAFIRPAISHI